MRLLNPPLAHLHCPHPTESQTPCQAVPRRRFLRWAAGAMVLSPLAALPVLAAMPERRLAFYQTHTGEAVEVPYWADGAYLPESLARINEVLRDHRTGEVSAIRPDLLDLLFALRTSLDSAERFHVISGFRSPATNAMLHARSKGVASRSLHMDGMAIDIRLPGRDLAQVRDAALALQAGGVGYYAGSDFVHVDVGRVRRW